MKIAPRPVTVVIGGKLAFRLEDAEAIRAAFASPFHAVLEIGEDPRLGQEGQPAFHEIIELAVARVPGVVSVNITLAGPGLRILPFGRSLQ